jgi:hypothetical protein
MEMAIKAKDRRTKHRFPLQRDVRYKMTEDGVQTAAGAGATMNIGSGGVAFTSDHSMHIGAFVELSISWPVLLDESLPMRLIVFGRIVRVGLQDAACSVDKYEFRTQSRTLTAVSSAVRSDSMLKRWVDGVRKEELKLESARA